MVDLTPPATGGRGGVRAPLWPAAAAAVAAVLSLALLVAGSSSHLGVALVGYLLGAVAIPVLVVVHRFLVRRARQSVSFIPQARLTTAIMTVFVVGFAIGVVHAWFVATELAKH